MARAELGTKRTDPETGRKFYDFGKDPVISPYTGTSYPLSFFEPPATPSRYGRTAPKPVLRQEPVETEAEGAEPAGDDEEVTVSLSDVEEGEGAAVARGADRPDDDAEDDEQSEDDDAIFALDDERDDVDDLLVERDEDEE